MTLDLVAELVQLGLCYLYFTFKDFIPYREGRIRAYRDSDTPSEMNRQIYIDIRSNYLSALLELPCDIITIATSCSLGRIFSLVSLIISAATEEERWSLCIKTGICFFIVIPVTVLVYYLFSSSARENEARFLTKYTDSNDEKIMRISIRRIIYSHIFTILFVNFIFSVFNFPI